MNELKPTYGNTAKDALEELAQSCLSEAYRKRFAVEVDAMTGDFMLSCMITGAFVTMAEDDLSEVRCVDLPAVIMRIVSDLLVKHIEQHAFKWGKE